MVTWIGYRRDERALASCGTFALRMAPGIYRILCSMSAQAMAWRQTGGMRVNGDDSVTPGALLGA